MAEQHEHAGHRERMRRRFDRNGLEGFAPHETLELLLFYAIPRRNVNPLAHRLIERFGSVDAVLRAPPEQLEQVPGIGHTAAQLLSLVLPLARYAQQEQRQERPVLANYRQAKEYCAHLFAGQVDEVLYVISLDAQSRVLRAAPVVRGTIDEITIYPRQVVSEALRQNAHAVVLAHNHPSGVAEPSEADLLTTEQLRDAFAHVDIALMDHMIYAEGECASIEQWKQLQKIAPLFPPEGARRVADQKRKKPAEAMPKQEIDEKD